MLKTDFWLIVFTGILALATVALAVSTIGLWKYAAEQARDMKDSIKIAGDTLHNNQRPWVIAENLRLAEPITFSPGHYEIHALIDYKNTGTSLASTVQVWIRLTSMRTEAVKRSWDGVVDDFRHHLDVIKAEPWPIGLVLAPNQSVTQPFGWGGPAGQPDLPTEQEFRGGAFLLLGYLEYVDQFKLRHKTRFAFHPDADSVHPWD